MKRTKQKFFFKCALRFFWKLCLFFVGISLFFTLLYKFVNPLVTPLMAKRFFEQVLDDDRAVRFQRDYVSIDEISTNLVDAVVAVEDAKFMMHSGFDWEQLKLSYDKNKSSGGKHVRGGSTISMQTAKNAFLPNHKSYVRKAFEAYFTVLIEYTWGKKRIMEVYLNIVEFGDGIYGCEAASQHYFGKSAKNLTAKEAAQLAVTLQSPLKRNPQNKTPYFRKRTATTLKRMVRVDLDKKIDN